MIMSLKKIELLSILKAYPLFTFNDFVKITGKGSNYCHLLISRLKKESLIFAIEKGKYTVYEDPLIYSSHIYAPSYISYWSALRFHNLTTQLPKDIFIAVPESKKSMTVNNKRLIFVKTKHFFGYEKTNYAGLSIYVADEEKAIIDSLVAKNVPFDELREAMAESGLDYKRLSDYALKTKNKTLIKRIGYLLKDKAAAQPLYDFIKKDMNYIPLDWSKPGRAKNKRWKVMV